MAVIVKRVVHKMGTTTTTTSKDNSKAASGQAIVGWTVLGDALYCILSLSYWAYRIRMQAIDEYGRVIHEFDPYFNYRATEVRVRERETKLSRFTSHHSSPILSSLPTLIHYCDCSISINMEPRSSFSGLITWSGEYEWKNE